MVLLKFLVHIYIYENFRIKKNRAKLVFFFFLRFCIEKLLIILGPAAGEKILNLSGDIVIFISPCFQRSGKCFGGFYLKIPFSFSIGIFKMTKIFPSCFLAKIAEGRDKSEDNFYPLILMLKPTTNEA